MLKKPITSFEQYITSVHKLTNSWGGYLWFRGVDNAKYSPMPALFWRKLQTEESSLVHDFLVAYKGILGSQTLNAWELYFLMQHHGLPTRLLDWTKSPLIALYFALERNPDYNGTRAVWVIDPQQLNGVSLNGEDYVFCPSELQSKIIYLPDDSKLNLNSYLPAALDETDTGYYPKFPLAIEPPLCNSRILAQSGCFTIHGNPNNTMKRVFEKVSARKRHFACITITGKKIRNVLLQHLYSVGIKEDSIYRDLDSLSRRIVREH